MITDELINHALAAAGGLKIEDVRAGLGYTLVRLTGGGSGLAYTFRNSLGNCCGILDEAGGLIGRDAADVIPWAGDGNLLKAAVGLAAVNAVFNVPAGGWETGNVMNEIRICKGDTFGMVGNFKPVLPRVRQMTDKIYVFEQDVPEGSGLYPESAIPEYLPKCGVVMITAISIINHSFDSVVSCCANAKEVCLVGPSTPLCPELFRRYGVTLLAGSIVTDPEEVARIVSQGGGTRAMKPGVKQVLCRI